MDKPVREGNRSPNRDLNGLVVQTLFGYLETRAPAGSVERILELAGETRSIAELSDASEWSTYAQYPEAARGGWRRCWAGPTACPGRASTSMIRSNPPSCSKLLSVFPTPADLYAALPALTESISPGYELRTESTGPNERRVSVRFKDGYEPFRENCAFSMSLLQLPRLFGYRDAEVFHESCQCDGAPYCQARVRWEAVDSDAVRASRAEMRLMRPRPASKSSTTRWRSSSRATASRWS
jgi:hypothetical protein